MCDLKAIKLHVPVDLCQYRTIVLIVPPPTPTPPPKHTQNNNNNNNSPPPPPKICKWKPNLGKMTGLRALPFPVLLYCVYDATNKAGMCGRSVYCVIYNSFFVVVVVLHW